MVGYKYKGDRENGRGFYKVSTLDKYPEKRVLEKRELGGIVYGMITHTCIHTLYNFFRFL